MVFCDGCEVWYHPTCIEMPDEVYAELKQGYTDEWFCHQCAKTVQKRKTGRAKTVQKRRRGRSMTAVENRRVYRQRRNDKRTALSHRRTKAALAAMGSPTCVCNGQVCKSIRPEELVPCGGYDAVRIGCNCAPTDLDHCPGAVGHENQVQERNDAATDKGWDLKTCLRECLDPNTGLSACGEVNKLPRSTKYETPFVLGYRASEDSLPLDVYVRHMLCRTQPLCVKCHRNVTSFRARQQRRLNKKP